MTGTHTYTERQAMAGTGATRVRSTVVCAMPANGSWHPASILFATHDPKPGPGGSP
jgi:hypothetical protein